jgi:hypothetical protein
VNDKLLNENIRDKTTLLINASLILLEEKISDVDHKISKLINQSDKQFDDFESETKDQPLHIKLIDSTRSADIEIISRQLKDSLESFGEKFTQNISKNGEKLEYLKRYLQIVFEQNVNKTISRPDELFMQIQRKERRDTDFSSMINEILSMVKEKLRSEEEKIPDSTGSLTDIISSFENMKSSTVTQKNKTTSSSSRKDGLIFPKVKNKPAKLNTSTFVSEYFGNKDIRVSKLSEDR